MIYYNRTLKSGERYTTSYKDLATAKRIASQESTSTAKKLWDGELYFDLNSGKFGADASGVGLVSYIKSEGTDGSGGRYAVFSKLNGEPNDLGIRFKTYGDANKFVRAIVGAYQELWVLEIEKRGAGKPAIEDDEVDLSEQPLF